MLGTLGFDEKGDVTGIEMWSWYRWENGTVVEKAPVGTAADRVANMGVAFLFGVPISEEEAWAWSWKIRRENRLVAVRRASLPRA